MAANSAISVTGLSFDTIRANLRTYISSKPAFADYDFEDSAIGTLLDLLAYNTYQNAFYVNMASNESFLDSAQMYDSVVSHAKTMGYTPVSAKGAVANVLITFPSPTLGTQSIPILKNTEFTATINGASYVYVTPKTYNVTGTDGQPFSQYINLVEGTPLTHNFLYTTSNTSFVLPNANTETSSITVSAVVNGSSQTFVPMNDVLAINAISKVFYIDADRDKKYKISFGDNVLGKKPDFNSVVTVNYRICNGQRGNGPLSFSGPASIGGYSNYVLTGIDRAAGGAPQEDIESIRFNAPKFYALQNRAVTKTDYSTLIMLQNPSLAGVNVWGGEENVPPIYGKIYCSVKPKFGTLISQTQKEEIKRKLAEYNLQSMDIEVVDATYLYVSPKVVVRYNPNSTTSTPSQVANAVANRIISYENTQLNLFSKNFRFSSFINYMVGADPSIVDVRATIDLRKKFAPSTVSITSYELMFNQELRRIGEAEQLTTVRGGSSSHPGFGFIGSTPFTYQGRTSYFEDNGFGIIRIYYRNVSVGRFGRVYTNKGAGVVDYLRGSIQLSNFLPSAYDGEITVSARPVYENVKPIRNQILLIDGATVQVVNDLNGNVEASVNAINTLGATTSLSAVTSQIQGITSY